MSEPTTVHAWMTRAADRISSSSDSPLAPPKASSAPKARASAKREILDLLGRARPQAYLAIDSLI